MLDALSLIGPIAFFGVWIVFILVVMPKLSKGSKAAERLLGGKVVREFGELETRKRNGATITVSALELDKDGERHLVLRSESKALLGWSVRFSRLGPEGRRRLRAAMDAMDAGG